MADQQEKPIILEFGATYDIKTEKKHAFTLPPDWMTISFLIESASSVEVAYPKFVLESANGAYKEEKTAKDDLVPGDKYLQLKFEKLLPGTTYKLTMFDDAEISRVVFEDVPFAQVVDQEREMHEAFVDHGFGELTFEDLGEKAFADWEAEEGAA